MLELKNICKSYKSENFETKALDNISVTFRDSEFVAVLGPSGSGKTTLLNVIGGLDHYDSGDLLINGKSTKKYKYRDWDHYRNNELGFVFQNYNLISHQSVLSNVELALTLSGIRPGERKKRAIKALEDVGLGDQANKKPNQLSGGQMQRVAIARALVNDPSIIFADEPTGALDTKTSITIMDILKEVSKDRLVVMVTHNPDIANKYATRIVNLKDAKITADSRPYDPKQENAQARIFKKQKNNKTSMSFLTALSLSFANLMGKKGRTFMTAFAGSIGIIGIAGILALSTGTRMYIDNVEKNTLSQYPLSISRTKSIMTSLNESTQGSSIAKTIEKMQYNQQEENKIGIRTYVSTMLTSSGANDLKGLKTYFDENPENLNSYANSIEYKYDTSPVIYSNDMYGQRQVFPQSNSSSTGSGSGVSAANNQSGNSTGITGPMAELSSTSSFFTLPSQENLYKDQYSIAAGKWPENANECVLVLHQDGTINDTLLYTLGLRDYNELKEAYKKYSNNEKANMPTKFDDVDYSQVLGHKFKFICPSDVYSYNEEFELFEDKTLDKDYMKNLIDNAEDLTIVGIAMPPEGINNSLSLTCGINYMHELNEKSIKKAQDSHIVKAQIATPEIDVLSGKTFAEEKSQTFDKNFISSLVQIDKDALDNFIKIDTNAFSALNIGNDIGISQDDIKAIIASAIDEKTIAKLVEDIATSQDLSKDMQAIIIEACKNFIDYQKTHPEATAETYFAEGGQGYAFIIAACAKAAIDTSPVVVKHLGQISTKIITELVRSLTSALTQKFVKLKDSLTGLENSIKINKDALSSVFSFDLSDEKLLQLSKLINGAGTRTYENNLADFGYADLSNPLSITIYPNDFNSKEKISTIIDNYNVQVEEAGHKEKAVSYSDYAKLLMTSITTMIDMITAVLIAFVAISLVVSSIMIGIITYISVLERTKEIGILRAIGARKRDIFNVFNAETFIVGIVAGIIGIVVTAIGCIPANIIAHAAFNVKYDIAILPIWAIFALIFISVLLTFIAGLIPSSSASEKDPVAAINS